MRHGFTVAELMIVLFIGAVLTAVGVTEFNETRATYELRNARNSLIVAAARARAEATRHGRAVRLEIDPAADRIRIRTSAGVIHEIFTQREYGADLQTPGSATIVVCFSTGAVVYQSCSSGTLPADVTFVRGTFQQKARVRPLGQVEATT